MKTKKGVSPVVATVLLIAIVVVLALIIFLWAKGFITESITKKGVPIEQKCGEVDLEVAYDGSDLVVTNRGNVPLFSFEIVKISGGSREIQEGNEKEKRLGIGQSTSISLGDYEKIEVTPVILGEAKTSKKAYTCKNNKFVAEV